jgi:methanogenic corrinoid protein MtbC1
MDNLQVDFATLQNELISALISVDRSKAKEILTATNPNQNPYHFIEELVVPALEAIGAGWESGEYSLSQVYMSGRICEEILVDFVLPSNHQGRPQQPKMAIVVLEDYHLLGKRIVYSVLRSSGFEVSNYDRMEVEELVKRVKQDNIEILLVSVLMLPSALRVKDLKIRLNLAGVNVKLVVGGAPFRFDQQLWREVGADAFGRSAIEAVEIVNRIIKEKA